MLTSAECPKNMLAIKDALDVVDGKWRLLILIALAEESKRFSQISKEVTGISDKMLSKELQALEINKLIKKDVTNLFPAAVEYSITAHGKSLEQVMKELYRWGLEHRKEIIGR